MFKDWIKYTDWGHKVG